MTHRSLSYSGLDEIDTGLQRPRSTLIQFQNGSTERQGEPRTRIPPSNHLIPENRTPSATRTFHQVGFDNSTEQARRHDLCGSVNIDPQREDLRIPNETGAFQNYIERNDAELKRIHAIAKISHPNEVVALATLKNGVWFSSKFREELAARVPISLDDALHRASYFATHEEEVAALKEQYSANKNNAAKKPTAPMEPATKGQHSYAIRPKNVEPRFAVRTKIRKPLKKPERERKSQGRETEQESPSSPPPAPKKRVDMISWGPKPTQLTKSGARPKGRYASRSR
ncbi:hypothetical protein Bca52824_080298 [Brassica carinata]|uniref:Uncharacterized protein n=1 Tax=Brassica carinata TaxID=52824 RepID=A0A8X7PFT4_BRACI|nr:hypothetical protein Bca52824_080298 [Brassica carinata]